jgi:hypothetical protein
MNISPLQGDIPTYPMPKRFFWWIVYRWVCHVTLWLFNIAMENDPFIDGLPIKNGDFPWLC